MQSFILAGIQKLQDEYIQEFSREHAIKDIYKKTYSEFKISDARTLIKTLSFKLHSSEKQLILISSPTIEAQQAILKTIEELPESAFVFFLVPSSDHLLDTISSRSKVINCLGELQTGNTQLQNDVMRFAKNDSGTAEALRFAEKYGQDKDLLQEILCEARELLVTEELQKKEKARLYFFVRELHNNYSLAAVNNIQPRILLESILFSDVLSH